MKTTNDIGFFQKLYFSYFSQPWNRRTYMSFNRRSFSERTQYVLSMDETHKNMKIKCQHPQIWDLLCHAKLLIYFNSHISESFYVSFVCHFLVSDMGGRGLERKITKCDMEGGGKQSAFCEWRNFWMAP